MDFFVPGRICLVGEHSDWASNCRKFDSSICKGYTIVTPTEQGIYAKAKLINDELGKHQLKFKSFECGNMLEKVFDLDDLRMLLSVAREGSWWSYIAGVAYWVCTNFKITSNSSSSFTLFIDNYETTLPIQKGWSSSASICVLVARVFNQFFNLQLSIRGEMEAAYQGERLALSECGRMDQAVAFGGKCCVFMEHDGDILETDLIKVGAKVYMLIVDLNASKDTKKILSDLNKSFIGKSSDFIRRGLGELSMDLVYRFKQELEVGDAQQLGHLFCEAQKIFDEFVAPSCPQELESPALHALLSNKLLEPFVFGGKGVGSQGDGTAQFICMSKEAQNEASKIIATHYPNMCAYKLTIG